MRNFRIFKTTKILVTALVLFATAGTLIWVTQYKNDNTEGADAAAQKVKVVGAYGDESGRIKTVNYNDADSNYGWPGDTDRTSIFSVNGVYKGLCAEPQAYDPVETEEKEALVYNRENRDLIRLLLFIYFAGLIGDIQEKDPDANVILDLNAWTTTEGSLSEVAWTLINDVFGENSVSSKWLLGLQGSIQVFGSGVSAAKKLVLTHETLGQLYHDDNDTNNITRAFNRLNNNSQTQMMADIGVVSAGSFSTSSGIVAKLNQLISSNSNIYKETQKYDVYYSNNIAQHQDVVWIAPKRGGLTIKKVDANSGSTTPQGNVSSFSGTEFHVYEKSNYDTNGDSASVLATLVADATGVASSASDAFQYGDYVVKESKSVNGYNLNETPLEVTINSSLNDYTSTPIRDSIQTGSLTIQKCDSATNLCTPQLGRSFAGITFEIYNNSTNPIYYNNVSYAKGAKIASQTAGEDGQVIFSNLPYGSYTVKEANGNEFYAKSDASLNLIVPDNSSTSNNFNNSPTSIGAITVKKCDEDLYNLDGSCGVQGDGDFSGIKFSLYKEDALVAGPTALTNGQVVFNNLADGSYVVKESGVSASYNINTEKSYPVTISGNDRNQSINVTNIIKRDRLTIQKCDAEISGCESQGNANFAGITFSVYNKSSKKIIYNDSIVEPNGLVATATTNEVGVAALGDLPYGTYMVKETGTNAYYNIDKNPNGSDIEKTISFADFSEGLTFSDTIKKGRVTVQKCDAELYTRGSCGPQGNASLSGIEFSIYNVSGKSIYHHGEIIGVNGIIMTATTNSVGVATFADLPYGKYEIKETGTNGSYNNDNTDDSKKQVVDLAEKLEWDDIVFTDTVKKGVIAVTKKDADVVSGAAQGNASFAGITFAIINNSGETISYDTDGDGDLEFVNNGETVTSKTLKNSENSVEFSGLPYGSYLVKESLGSNTSYLLGDSETQPAVLSSSYQSANLVFENRVVRGDVKFIKISDVDGAAMSNVPFKITLDKTGESHIVVTDEDGVINTSSTYAKHSINTNAYDDVEEYAHEETGVWFGTGTLDDDRGALPYGNYTITELECDENFYCEDRNAEKVFRIDENNEVVDLGEWENDCLDPEIKTFAENAEDGTKEISPKSEAKIKDTIEYCLKAGEKFRFVGILMNKETGEPLEVDGKTVTAESVVTPDENCGKTEIVFEFNASDLAEKDIVVFERVYLGEEELDGTDADDLRFVAKHEDLEDSDQTIHVLPKIADTGIFSNTETGAIFRGITCCGGLAIVVYVINMVRRKKKVRF